MSFGRLSARHLAIALLISAVVLFVATALFGINAPVQWGHYGYHIGEYTLRARNSIRFETIIPSHWTGVSTPPPSSLYLHHPILAHHFLTLAFLLFGEHLWLVRAVPAMWGLVTLVAIFVLVRRHWAPLPAGVAALAYATMPFTAAFLTHYDPGHLAMPALVIGMDAWLRMRERPRWSTAAVAIGAFAVAGLSEWTPYFCTTFFVPIAFVIGWSALERDRSRFGFRPSQAVAFGMGLAMVAVLGFHFLITYRAGMLPDLMSSYRARSSRPNWDTTQERQWLWLTMYFGKTYVVMAALWAATLLGRLVAGRGRARDLVPATFLLAWMLYVAMFTVGVNIHSYRVMPLAPFLAIATGSVFSDWSTAIGSVVRRLSSERVGRVAAAVVFGAGAVALFGLNTPHALRTMRDARRTAGTAEFHRYDPHLAVHRFAQEAHKRIPRDALVIVHNVIGPRLEFISLLDREIREVGTLPAPGEDKKRRTFVLWDHDWINASDKAKAVRLVQRHGVTLFGSFAMVDLSSTEPVAESYKIAPGKASLAYKFFSSWDHPPLHLEPSISRAMAYWLAVNGVRLKHRPPDVQRPADSDLPGLVNYQNLLTSTNATADELADIDTRITARLNPGTDCGAVRVVGWMTETKRRRVRVVLAPCGQALPKGQLAVRAEADGHSARAALQPEIAEQTPDSWKAGYYYLLNATLPATIGGPTQLWLTFDRGCDKKKPSDQAVACEEPSWELGHAEFPAAQEGKK